MAPQYFSLNTDDSWETRKKSVKRLERLQQGMVGVIHAFSFALCLLVCLITLGGVAGNGFMFFGTFAGGLGLGVVSFYATKYLTLTADMDEIYEAAKYIKSLKASSSLADLEQLTSSMISMNSHKIDALFNKKDHYLRMGTKLLGGSLLPIFGIAMVLIMALVFSNPITSGVLLAVVAVAGVCMLAVGLSVFIDTRILKARRQGLEALAKDLDIEISPKQTSKEIGQKIDTATQARLFKIGESLRPTFEASFSSTLTGYIAQFTEVCESTDPGQNLGGYVAEQARSARIVTTRNIMRDLSLSLSREPRNHVYLCIYLNDLNILARQNLTPQCIADLVKNIWSLYDDSVESKNLMIEFTDLLIRIYPDEIPVEIVNVCKPIASSINCSYHALASYLLTKSSVNNRGTFWAQMLEQNQSKIKTDFTPSADLSAYTAAPSADAQSALGRVSTYQTLQPV